MENILFVGEYFIMGLVNWPPRTCDLTLLDYFLLGYVKVHAYTDKLGSINALQDNIKAFIRETSAEMLERVWTGLKSPWSSM